MKVIHSLSELESVQRFGVTIGNFDGVHLGHQELLKEILKQTQAKGEELVMMTFVPHPLAVLSPDTLQLINSYEERRELLERAGVKYLCEVKFTRDLSLLGPDGFMDKHLLANKGLTSLYLGYDFAFGANKQGDFTFVQEYCKGKSIDVVHFAELKKSESKVSSTNIRNLVSNGEVKEASRLLGREYFLRGRVTKGAGRGVQIGFPTANLEQLTERVMPKRGVYITKTTLRGQSFMSVTNVGVNPTFNTHESVRVETYILDFKGDIYGEEIQVNFFERLRDEMKFDSVEQLKLQIALDVKKSFEYFGL